MNNCSDSKNESNRFKRPQAFLFGELFPVKEFVGSISDWRDGKGDVAIERVNE